MTTPKLSDADARALAVAVAREVMGWPVVEEVMETRARPVPFLDASGPRLWAFLVYGAGVTWEPHLDANQALAVLCKARGEPAAPFSVDDYGTGYIAAIDDTSGVGATIGEAVCRAALARANGK